MFIRITPFRSALASAALAGMFFSTPAHAQTEISDPWVRATVPHQKSTGAFMHITARQDARLVEASSPRARRVEIHEMKIEDGVMKMREIDGVPLSAGKPVELKPGGYHLMLTDLASRAEAGTSIPLTLVIEHKDGKRENLNIDAPVRPLTGGRHTGHHGH